jgi:hypothetical protein
MYFFTSSQGRRFLSLYAKVKIKSYTLAAHA